MRRRAIAAAAIVGLAGGALALHRCRRDDERARPAIEAEDSTSAGPAGRRDRAAADDDDRAPPRPGQVPAKLKAALARMRASLWCPMVPAALCAQAGPIAEACWDGDVAACVRAADLMAGPPRMPDDARRYLLRACRLHDATACARVAQLDAWSHSAAAASLAISDGESPPDRIAADACAAGEVDACWFVAYFQLDGQPFDQEAGARACHGQVAEACRDLARAAPDPGAAVSALEQGCGHDGVAVCRALYSVLVGDGLCCGVPAPDPLDRDGCIPCPPRDPAHAAAVAARIEALTGAPFVYTPTVLEREDDQ